MRELVAIIFAVAGAALAFFFLSGPLANWAALQIPVSSPDENDNWHDLIFMIANVGGLVAGGFAGWMIAGPLASGERPPR